MSDMRGTGGNQFIEADARIPNGGAAPSVSARCGCLGGCQVEYEIVAANPQGAGCQGCDYQGGTDNTTNLIRRNRESTP